MSNLYHYRLIDIAKNPENFGAMPDADSCSKQYNPSCGDQVVICLTVKHGVVQRVMFDGTGCIISIAMASLLTKHAAGKPCVEIMAFDDTLVDQLLGIQLGPNRLKCGLLSIMALQNAVSSIKATDC